MTKIEEMLAELCPNGVEWYKLGEVCLIANSNRKPVKANLRIAGDIPYYGANNIQDYVQGYTHDGEYILIAEDGSASLENYSIQWVSGKFWANNHVHVVHGKDILNNRFLYHYLKKLNFAPFLSGGGRAKLTKAKLLELPIPIPPLEIQQKIVQILDKFTKYVTELTAELTAELTFRKQQYSYYRDKLLSFEDEVYQVEWKRLGDILVKGRGTKITASQMKELHKERGPIRIFAGGKTFADVDYGDIPEKDVHNEEAIIVKSRGIIDFEYYTKPFSFKNEFWSYSSDNDNVNLRYIYHYLTHNKAHFQHIADNMQMPQISGNDTERYSIPLPNKIIQARIVQVLDNFDTVCNDLKIGLPKEIALRQKQYEFFREKLLTFTAEGVYAESRVEELGHSDFIKILQWVFGPIRVSLGSICDFTRGNGLQKKDFVEEGYPVIHYGQIYTCYGFSTKETKSFAAKGVFDKLKKAQPYDIIMATTSENVEDVGKAVVWEGETEVGISGDAYIIKTSQNARYLNYFLKSIHFQIQKEKRVTGTKVIRINAKDMENFLIPLPPLNDQSLIVSILDKFDILTSDLTKGLPKEIEQRQKQYEYFRDRLLRF